MLDLAILKPLDQNMLTRAPLLTLYAETSIFCYFNCQSLIQQMIPEDPILGMDYPLKMESDRATPWFHPDPITSLVCITFKLV